MLLRILLRSDVRVNLHCYTNSTLLTLTLVTFAPICFSRPTTIFVLVYSPNLSARSCGQFRFPVSPYLRPQCVHHWLLIGEFLIGLPLKRILATRSRDLGLGLTLGLLAYQNSTFQQILRITSPITTEFKEHQTLQWLAWSVRATCAGDNHMIIIQQPENGCLVSFSFHLLLVERDVIPWSGSSAHQIATNMMIASDILSTLTYLHFSIYATHLGISNGTRISHWHRTNTTPFSTPPMGNPAYHVCMKAMVSIQSSRTETLCCAFKDFGRMRQISSSSPPLERRASRRGAGLDLGLGR